MGTHWEQGNKTKKSLLPPLKKEKTGSVIHECMPSLPIGCMKFLFPNCRSPFLAWANSQGKMLSLPIGCMKFLSPKLFVTIFDLG
jgi:hypothetical protein